MHEHRLRQMLEAHIAQGRFDAALVLLEQWQGQAPRQLLPELIRARLEFMQGRYRAARARFLQAVQERECAPSDVLELVNGLRLFVAHDAMIAWAESYPHRNALRAVDQVLAAASLSTIGAQDLARRWADEAVAKAPDDGICRVNRALILNYAGDFDAARADLDHVLGGPQESAMGYWLAARVSRQTPDRNHVGALRERLGRSTLHPRDREFLYFALFKELDDLGDRPGAWEALSAGCRVARTRAPYDAAMQERLFAHLRQPIRAVPVADPPPVGAPVPIFIVGMHRSGTTLLESMLSAHPEVHAYGESQRLSAALRLAADRYCQGVIDDGLAQRLPDLDYRAARDSFLGEGRRLVGQATHVTEKMPGNFQLVGAIRHALPHARVIHMRRDPMDVCFANLREHFADGVSHANSAVDVAHYHALYRGLMAHWQEVYPGFVLDVDYESLVTDPVAESRRVYAFCGLPWDDGVTDPARWAGRAITTLSSLQARGTIHRNRVGGWRAYAQWLEPLQEALGVTEVSAS
ncbi:sulfotransferase family protein [Tahibacter amnicola]|uniref:Sulfotransferase n=1 Tax=Tahibacter amnicola TaxID=2976241 RepID=A0ABY6BKZ7_9GAMM|nr:tetratricopeptide repeat-containing sulfotransferase family protein [Tahibacter amnicola]UXI70147.1 sulfotransferase [Tahibacter amnicola]